MIVAGIDPGKTGAMTILYPDNSGTVFRVPLMKKGKTEPAWFEWWGQWRPYLSHEHPDMVVIEQVGARPTQGVTSMFSFGRSLGFVHAIAVSADCPVYWVTPAVWKGKLGLLKADKNASREEVRRLMPRLAHEVARVKDDGVAESALLAYYGRKYLCTT